MLAAFAGANRAGCRTGQLASHAVSASERRCRKATEGVYSVDRIPCRQADGVTPIVLLNERLNAASDS